MAKTQKTNPLGGVTKKPASYVGDLDDLLGQVADEPETDPPSEPERHGRGGTTPKHKTSKKEMKIAAPTDIDIPRSRINLLLPTTLHRQFKAKAATEGVTMTSVLETFIRDYVGE